MAVCSAQTLEPERGYKRQRALNCIKFHLACTPGVCKPYFHFCVGIKEKVDVSGISELSWSSNCFDIACTIQPQACVVEVAEELHFGFLGSLVDTPIISKVNLASSHRLTELKLGHRSDNAKKITSEIWPQSNIITFQESVHRFFNHRHIARVTDTADRSKQSVHDSIYYKAFKGIKRRNICQDTVTLGKKK